MNDETTSRIALFKRAPAGTGGPAFNRARAPREVKKLSRAKGQR